MNKAEQIVKGVIGIPKGEICEERENSILFNPNFWWMVGYLYGDGCFSNKRLSCNSIDNELPLKVQKLILKFFGVNGKIRLSDYQKKYPNRKVQYVFEVREYEIFKFLNKTRILLNGKRNMSFKLPEKRTLFLPFIAGFFDAEGSILTHKPTHPITIKKYGRIIFELTISSSKNCILKQIRKSLRYGKVYRFDRTRHNNKKEVEFRLSFTNSHDINKFLKEVIPYCCCERKINKFNEYPISPFLNDRKRIGNLVKWKLIKRNLKVTPKLKEKLINLRKEGLSYPQIARKINFYVCSETIRRQILGISKTYHFDNYENKILSKSKTRIIRDCSEKADTLPFYWQSS